jgi:hypothetical protein
MRQLFLKGVVIFGGIAAVPAAVAPASLTCLPALVPGDPRLGSLRRALRDCPAQQYSEVFLLAADTHNIDWRLLPSIALVESGGGRMATNNNYFGWNNGKADFPSVGAGIHRIAERLENSKYYRDKELDEVLHTYNPVGDYPKVVRSVMNRIAPEE